MTKEYSNEEFGFGSNAYAEPAAKRKEDEIAKSPSTPAKIQQAAITAVAPPVEAASAQAPVAVAAPLPPLPTASAGAPPAIQNPAETADFWSSALKGVGIPVGAGLAAGAAGNYLMNKFRGGGEGGGPAAAGPAAPTVDEEMRQLRLAKEQAKLDLLYQKDLRQQQLHEANLARMQQAPAAGAPVSPAAAVPPVDVAPAPVAPKPIDPVMQKRIDLMDAAERRKQELHDLELAEKKQRIELAKQKSQGQPVSQYSNEDKQYNKLAVEGKVDKDIAASASKTKAPVSKAEKALEAVASTKPTTAPVATVPTPAATAIPSANEVSLPKEWNRKGMGWLTSQYGIEGAQQFIDAHNKGKPFASHAEMQAAYEKAMVKPSFNTMPKDIRKERGITVNPEHQQYKIVPGGIVPPTLPSGGGGGGMVVPRGGVGNIPGANEQIHTLNPLKL